MHFSGEITLGTILTIVTLIGMAVGAAVRFTRFEMTQEGTTRLMQAHIEDDKQRFSAIELRLERTHRLLGRLAGAGRNRDLRTRDTDFLDTKVGDD